MAARTPPLRAGRSVWRTLARAATDRWILRQSREVVKHIATVLCAAMQQAMPLSFSPRRDGGPAPCARRRAADGSSPPPDPNPSPQTPDILNDDLTVAHIQRGPAE